jgi:RNA polymerase sigma-B factor
VSYTPKHEPSERDTATARLLQAYHEGGDIRARDRLVRLYLPLVETFAHRYGRRGAEHDDLMQAGSLGLLNAIERYDRRRGEEFTAYAVPTIVGEIKRYVRDRVAPVKLPRPLQEAGARLAGARSDLTARLGRTPTTAELAAELGVAVDDLARLEEARRAQVLVDEPNGGLTAVEDGGRELDLSDERLQLAGAFRTLDQTEQTIIYLRFVKDLSRKQTANQLGISEGQLSRRMQAALTKLRRELERSASGHQAAAPTQPASAGPPPAANAQEPEGHGPEEPPDPRSGQKPKDGHSGRLLLRMPHSLHAELAEAAEREEVSLNQFITNTLAAAVSWQKAGKDGVGGADPRQSPRWLPAAIVSNMVVVALAGIVALVLLIVAWQHGW